MSVVNLFSGAFCHGEEVMHAVASRLNYVVERDEDLISRVAEQSGVKAGAQVGATDELGYRITEDPIHIHDFQATVMALMGFNHERLTFHFQGRDYRLTDVHGNVRPALMA